MFSVQNEVFCWLHFYRLPSGCASPRALSGMTQGCLCPRGRGEGCPGGQGPGSAPRPAPALKSQPQPCHQGSSASLLIPAPPGGVWGSRGVQGPFPSGSPFPGCCPGTHPLDSAPCAPGAQCRLLVCEQRLQGLVLHLNPYKRLRLCHIPKSRLTGPV